MPLTVVTDVAPRVWDQFVELHPASHFLQTSLWGSLKAQFGWETQRVALADRGHLKTKRRANDAPLVQREVQTSVRRAYAPASSYIRAMAMSGLWPR